MKRLCFIVGLALLTLGASLPPSQVAQFFAPAAASAESLLVYETFESGVNPGWTTGGVGTKNFNNTSNVLAGSVSLAIAGNGNAYTNFTASSEVWVVYRVKFALFNAGGNTFPQQLMDSGGASLAFLRVFESGGGYSIRLTHGSVFATTVDTAIPMNSDGYIWLYYAKGTGADGVASCEFTTTNVRTGTGNRYVEVTTGTATADASRFYTATPDANYSFIFDNVQISNTGWPVAP